MITFISGGVRSGKSTFAERIALSCLEQKKGNNLYYVATTFSYGDEEMASRIKRHQDSRGRGWTTIEEPFKIDDVIRSITRDSIVLVDCLTVWTSNVLFHEGKDASTLRSRLQLLLQTSIDNNLTLILVSNDLNEELPIKDYSVQNYMRSLEAVHSLATKYANQAIQVIAGLPVYWKGEDDRA